MEFKILVVDDHQIMRAMIRNMLNRPEFHIVEASNGKQAIDILEHDPKISLVLSDVNMPEMDGVQFLDKRMALEHHKTTPIIMITSERSQELISSCKKKGVAAWISKPFKKEELLEVMANILY